MTRLLYWACGSEIIVYFLWFWQRALSSRRNLAALVFISAKIFYGANCILKVTYSVNLNQDMHLRSFWADVLDFKPKTVRVFSFRAPEGFLKESFYWHIQCWENLHPYFRHVHIQLVILGEKNWANMSREIDGDQLVSFCSRLATTTQHFICFSFFLTI